MGLRWSARRAAVLARDSGCRRCGTPRWEEEAWPIDHLIPRRLFPLTGDDAHAVTNLALLCASCHAFKTHVVEPAFYQGDVQTFRRFLEVVGQSGPIPSEADLARAYTVLTDLIRQGVKT
jgi:HNH endonuclease